MQNTVLIVAILVCFATCVNGAMNANDFSVFLESWLAPGDYDMNDDGIVNLKDFSILVSLEYLPDDYGYGPYGDYIYE